MDGIARIHEQEVDHYTDAILEITGSDASPEEKRAKIRTLVEWLI